MQRQQFESQVPPFAPGSHAHSGQAPYYDSQQYQQPFVPPTPSYNPGSEPGVPPGYYSAQPGVQQAQSQKPRDSRADYPNLFTGYQHSAGVPPPAGQPPSTPDNPSSGGANSKGPQFYHPHKTAEQDIADIKKSLLSCYRKEMDRIRDRYFHLDKKIKAAETALINAMISTSAEDIDAFVKAAARIDEHLSACEKYQPWAIAAYCLAAAIMIGTIAPVFFTFSFATVCIALVGVFLGPSLLGIVASSDSFRYSSSEAVQYRQAHQDADRFLQPYLKANDQAFFTPPNGAPDSVPSAPPQDEAPPPPSYDEATRGHRCY